MASEGLQFEVLGPPPSRFELSEYQCFAAGYTGRDRAAIDAHIRELAEEGIPPPPTVPFCFPVLQHLVRAACSSIEVYGSRTSGEIEPVLIVLDGQPRYLGLGSDHTDRELEKVSIPISKQLCQKVVASELWPVSSVAELWDQIEISSSQDGETYQKGHLGDLLPIQVLLETIPRDRLGACAILFGGTLPVIGGLRCGHRFEGLLRNPATGATLSLAYDITTLEAI